MTPALIFTRDMTLYLRRGGGMWATVGFCLVVFALFAFSLGPEGVREHAARVLAVTVLLSCLLALPNLFERDHADGTLEQYLLQPGALEWLVFAKFAAFWLANALPLIIITPLLALMAGLEKDAAYTLTGALLLATPTLCAIGLLGAALTLGARRSGVLQALIILPLYIPPLIFLASFTTSGAAMLLAAMLCVSLPLACLLGAALLRLGVE